ncbi:MAG: hypothetical protein HYV38_03500, partial [Candidatus Levybacteria bacterium]|nr:hypothetical protein [Candidatus Levybacteria bacterium]
ITAAGTFSESNSGNEGNNQNLNNLLFPAGVTVAGFNNISNAFNDLTKGVDTKNKVKINLAWLVMASPLLVGAFLTKKYLKRRNSRLPSA